MVDELWYNLILLLLLNLSSEENCFQNTAWIKPSAAHRFDVKFLFHHYNSLSCCPGIPQGYYSSIFKPKSTMALAVVFPFRSKWFQCVTRSRMTFATPALLSSRSRKILSTPTSGWLSQSFPGRTRTWTRRTTVLSTLLSEWRAPPHCESMLVSFDYTKVFCYLWNCLISWNISNTYIYLFFHPQIRESRGRWGFCTVQHSQKITSQQQH